MENVDVVQSFQALDHLDEDAPDVFLSQIGLLTLVASDLLEQISIVGIFHHNADYKQTWVVKMKALLNKLRS